MTPLKKYILVGAGILACLLVAFATGRYTVPTKTVTVEKEKVVEKVVEKIDDKKVFELTEKISSLEAEKQHFQKNVKKTEHIHKNADGSTDITRTYDSTETKVVEKEVVKYLDREVKVVETKVVDRVVDRVVTVEKEKIVDAQKPQWKLTPMVGVNVRDFQISQSLTTGPLTYGGMAERRIVGPIFLGVWGMSSGSGGIAATVEF
jgi:hypothetical protein